MEESNLQEMFREKEMKKIYGLYSICQCNHESSYHNKLKKCSATIPVGCVGYRGWVSSDIKSETCSCLKFKFSAKNTANPKSSEDIES
jgi:hypothetical protein